MRRSVCISSGRKLRKTCFVVSWLIYNQQVYYLEVLLAWSVQCYWRMKCENSIEWSFSKDILLFLNIHVYSYSGRARRTWKVGSTLSCFWKQKCEISIEWVPFLKAFYSFWTCIHTLVELEGIERGEHPVLLLKTEMPPAILPPPA